MTNVSRAERRRAKRDPLFRDKLVAGLDAVPEYDRLISYGRVLLVEMSEIQNRMNGIPFARGRRGIGIGSREGLQEALVADWNEHAEKLEGVQTRLKEIEEEAKKKEQEKPLIITNDSQG